MSGMAGVMYAVMGIGIMYWMFFMGGKDQVVSVINEFTGGKGLGDIFKSETSSTGESTTDEKGNNTNVDSDTNTESNVSANGDEEEESDENTSETSQSDSTGDAKQTQSSKQTSSKGTKSTKSSNYTYRNVRESFFTKYGG